MQAINQSKFRFHIQERPACWPGTEVIVVSLLVNWPFVRDVTPPYHPAIWVWLQQPVTLDAGDGWKSPEGKTTTPFNSLISAITLHSDEIAKVLNSEVLLIHRLTERVFTFKLPFLFFFFSFNFEHMNADEV